MEDLVVGEATAQRSRLNTSLKEQISVSEVSAYALNHLPTMYATTARGWQQQRKRAQTELGGQIATVVRQAMLRGCQDNGSKTEPLPEVELENQARSLAKLQRVLQHSELRWRDIPNAVESALVNARVGLKTGSDYAGQRSSSIGEVKRYLQRTKVNSPASSHSTRISADARDFESYMLEATCGFRNTLERLVLSIVLQQLQRLDAQESRSINPYEVTAYALNRLPPMYATNGKGLKLLRQRAKDELANSISSVVQQAILTISKMPVSGSSPLPFQKFKKEQEEALDELKKILQRHDVSWQNAANLVEEALEETQRGEINWVRRSQYYSPRN